jgi:hypothetical protein
VLFRLGVTILLGHAKIDDVDDIGGFGAWSADEEIVRFDISVDEVLFVNRLYPRKLEAVSKLNLAQNDHNTNHLFCNHDDGFNRKLPIAVVEEVLQTRSEQIDDQNVVQALLAKVVDIRNTRWAMSVTVKQTRKWAAIWHARLVLFHEQEVLDVLQVTHGPLIVGRSEGQGCLQTRVGMHVKECIDLRHPTRILYVRYSSLSCGASLFRGS